MPDVGEGLTEAEVLSWRVEPGDVVTVNQILVEIETAKAAVELPSPFAGRIDALLVPTGELIPVGTPIIAIRTGPDAGADPGTDGVAPAAAESLSSEYTVRPDDTAGAKIGETMADGRIATLVGYLTPSGGATRRARRPVAGAVPPAAPAPVPPATPEPVTPTAPDAGARAPLATPPVRKLAKELGVDLADVVAERPDGVISRAEVHAAAAAHAALEAAATTVENPPADPRLPALRNPDYDPATRESRVPIRGIRRATATAVTQSAFTAPHVTEFVAVDVTPMMELRERLRKRPEYARIKLTPLAFVARAVCLAVRRTPEVNATWDEDTQEIVYKQYVNLGIAAATNRGLIVPKVRDADRLDLLGLATAFGELTETARAGRTTPAMLAGGTFTITNVGVLGVDSGTPILNPGESAILALGSIKDAPWVVDGALAVRKVCHLALSFDHRIVDGQQGSQFLADVAALLADPGLAITF
ncbi:2-oxo acid dehydrogenase subunit E2 [Nakamurella flavida]|uniref:Dihydrolipoamide acetyltransferase component of pyruvate dehydrogenase complex n=1 Tax=Nakamurella flavida TaxID=363630 RepID=A0A938YNI4_9ACTN|nr:dihydrolipoamide acetyltransferase family protein [Nakamurella flavida]MBM9476622.1 2-oxo acid dehydrogenase subunit E2 [Nakamurella flavida]